MRKVCDWVFGSFFRTIGRLLVFVLIGIIISNLVDFGSLIDNFSITNLFFEKVKAETYQTFNVFGAYGNNVAICQGYGNPYNCSTISAENGFYKSTSFFNYVNDSFETFKQYLVYFNSSGAVRNIPTGTASVDIPIKLSMSNGQNTYYITNHINTNQDWTTSQEQGIGFIVETFSSTGTIGICQLRSNVEDIYYLNCPVTTNVQYLRFRFYYKEPTLGLVPTNSVPFTWGYKDAWTWVIDTETQINNSIQEQTQQQQQQHNETMQQQQQQHQEVMDNNTTQAEEEADGFFGNFTVSDTGGLNAIITAPLNTIRSLLNSSCSNLILPLPFVNNNLTLPCLYPIYNEHFGAFFTIYQTIILAIISYRCLRSIFFDIKGFGNPDDDRIEVMDL